MDQEMDRKKKKSEKMKYTGMNRIIRSGFIQTLINKVDDGTFRDFWYDWKWIFYIAGYWEHHFESCVVSGQ